MKISILIVDDDYKNIIALADAMQQSRRIENVLVANDVDGALVLAKKVDFIVLNPMLSRVDGMDLLHQLIARNLRPGVIILSSFYSPEMLCELNELSVVYCMYKPVNTKYLIRRIENWCKGSGTRIGGQKLQIQRRITAILQELGMTPISGYYDCCKAIEWLCTNGLSRGKITTEMYPSIASTTGQSSKQIERNIRYAIEQTWLNGNLDVLNRYFKNSVSPECSRPSNASFLRTIADYLQQSGMIVDGNGNRAPDKDKYQGVSE